MNALSTEELLEILWISKGFGKIVHTFDYEGRIISLKHLVEDRGAKASKRTKDFLLNRIAGLSDLKVKKSMSHIEANAIRRNIVRSWKREASEILKDRGAKEQILLTMNII